MNPGGVASDWRRRVWLFDLDNTLHHASPHIFPHINQAMHDYIVRELQVDSGEATRLRQHYWERYGATLLGLVRHHGIDADHFLWHTHQFPELSRQLVLERGLAAMLRRLPGRKLIFSNAPIHYTRAVLKLARIDRLFGAVYSIEQLRYRPKPAIQGFRQLLQAERLDPRRCILVEDTLANLGTARRLGMKTVWVTRGHRSPPEVDVQISSILDLPRQLTRL